MPSPARQRTPQPYSLFRRVGAANAAIFLVAVLALALSPATVSFPVTSHELAVLMIGVVALVGVNLAVLRHALSPLVEVSRQMAAVDLLDPDKQGVGHSNCREIGAITQSFNDMVERLQFERSDSARREVVAQEAERQRMAHELHDDIGQSLTVLLLELMQASREANGTVRDRLADAQETTRLVLEDVRQLGRRLRPESLDDLGLGQALETLAGRVSAASGIDVETKVEAGLRLRPETELVILRAAQEGLTNAIKHSGASSVVIELESHHGGGVVFSVSDDGRGATGPVDGRGGLRGMQVRAMTVGGRVSVEPGGRDGFAVRVWLPKDAMLAPEIAA